MVWPRCQGDFIFTKPTGMARCEKKKGPIHQPTKYSVCVEQPQTNGVAERFNRPVKDQAIHGRVFRNVGEVRAAIVAFIARYNSAW